ncbi:glucosyltransferase domain-containing protein [Mesorhizobium sp. CA5]|uniref:glucosyltransferase domain-containing protein n=1 Tax=Mesorhizobium sp. CA5 TaxID=2876638 RepID=UPI001CD1877F|nr:glucosyltransferase domain-containing protein [Mesorhizobium sp. CA5]MBZ9845493.1 glucosyltransferase domain-containing protein [Mesorhizobium sp. CA5]
MKLSDDTVPFHEYINPVAVLLLIFAALYWSELSTFTLSQDDELAAFRQSADVWLSQGRWGIYLVERFLMPRPIIPYLPMALYGILSSIGYLFVLKAYGFKPGAIAYVIFPIFVAYPSWFWLLEFGANIASAGFGILAVSASTYVFSRLLAKPIRKISLADICAHVLLGGIAASFYQTIILSKAVLLVGLIIVNGTKLQWNSRTILINITLAVMSTVGSLITYALILKVFLAATETHLAYIQNFLDLETFGNRPFHVLATTLYEVLAVYSGSIDAYGVFSPTFVIPIAFGVISTVWAVGCQKANWLLPLATILLLLVPFVQFPLAGGSMPLRALVAVPATVWVMAAIGFKCAPLWMSRLAFISAPLIALQLVNVLAQLEATSSFLRTHDQLLAGAIYSRISDTIPDFRTDHIYKIDIYGGKQFKPIYYPGRGSTASNSFFGLAGGQTDRIVNYMYLIGFTNLEEVSQEERTRLIGNYADMPIWPQPKSVRFIDGTILVRLGEQPSVDHLKIRN